MVANSKYPVSVKAGKPILGFLPNGWVSAPLNYYLELIPRKVKINDDVEYALVTVKRSRGGVVRREHLLGKDISVKSQFYLEKGDFLVSKRQIVHGACGIVPKDLAGSIVSNEYSVFKAKSNFDLSYLNYLSETLYFQQACFHSSIGVHIEKMIFKLDSWFKWNFNIPPLPEQKKIIRILSIWDKAITTTEKLIANSQQHKKALMQQLLTGKKRLLSDSGIRFVGKWNEKKVNDFFVVGSSKRVLQENWTGAGVPFYRTRELVSLSKNKPFSNEIYISEKLFSELASKYGIPSEGDFLVSGVGTLGICYQVKKGDRFYFKDGNVLWFKKKLGIDSHFFKYCFQSDYIQNQITDQASITTVGTYTIQNAKKTRFYCPPTMEEQKKIAAVLSVSNQEIITFQRKLDCLKQEKKALMQQLLTGKRRVKLNK